MRRYVYDKEFIFQRVIKVRRIDPYPRRSTTEKPPKTRGTQVARWIGESWEILSERPGPPVVIASTLPALNFHLALKKGGYLEDAEAFFSTKPGRQIRWQRSLEFDRNSGLIRSMQEALTLTDEQMNDLFTVVEDEDEEIED